MMSIGYFFSRIVKTSYWKLSQIPQSCEKGMTHWLSLKVFGR